MVEASSSAAPACAKPDPRHARTQASVAAQQPRQPAAEEAVAARRGAGRGLAVAAHPCRRRQRALRTAARLRPRRCEPRQQRRRAREPPEAAVRLGRPAGGRRGLWRAVRARLRRHPCFGRRHQRPPPPRVRRAPHVARRVARGATASVRARYGGRQEARLAGGASRAAGTPLPPASKCGAPPFNPVRALPASTEIQWMLTAPFPPTS